MSRTGPVQANGASANGAAVAAGAASRAHGYEALRSFAQERHLQLVGEIVEGSRFKITGLDSLAWCHLTAPDKSVYLGEAMEWRGERYTGVARMRLTGDLLWKLDGFLHPEIMFINAPALAAWPEGERRGLEAGDEWRWELLRAARQHGHVLLSHRTLADCDTQWGVRSGLRAGMFDYYSAATERTVKVRLLRRVEPAVKRAARVLPMKWQDAGTRLWYHIAR
jgi:hypothetical protein